MLWLKQKIQGGGGGGGGGRVYFMHEDLESSTISDLWADLLMHWA